MRHRKYKGSLTVEASFLMPLILFLMVAVLLLILFMHDYVTMRSLAVRYSEAALWEDAARAGGTDAAFVALSDAQISEQNSGFSLATLLHQIKSDQTSVVTVSGRMMCPVWGSRQWMGDGLYSDVTVTNSRVNYRADWLKTVILLGKKPGGE